MKKIIKWLLLLILIFCVYQMIVFFFVKEHHHTYIVGKGKASYTIHEHFKIIQKKHIYTYEIVDSKKRKYHFQIDKNLNKRDKVIQKIETYQKDNLTCIYPVLLKETPSDILCLKDKKEYSSSYFLQKEDENIKEFIEKLEQKGYQNEIWSFENPSSKAKDIVYYKENLLPSEYLYFWTYQGLSKIQKEGVTSEKLFTIDKYENNQSILVGKTLVVVDSDQKYDFDKFYFVSLKDEKKEEMKLQNKISQDSYFCGFVGNKAYLIDRKNLKQYEIDVQKKKIKLVGNKENNAQYYDGTKWTTRNIYDFVKEDIYFAEEIPSKIKKKYPNATILKGNARYYLIEKNKVSMIHYLYIENPILLFEMNELKETTSIEDALLFINKDTVYQYHPTKGLRKLFTSRELLFHQENMYGAYLES